MKRFWTIALALALVAVAAVLGWRALKTGDDPSPGTEAQSGPSNAEVIASMKAARRSGNFDRAPAKARGRVVRATDGVAVVGALVMVRAASSERTLSLEPILRVTDETGDWSVEGLAPGRYAVSASAQGLLPEFLTKVELKAGVETADLELSLSEGGKTIAGVVTDHQGRPLADVRVEAMRMSDQQSGSVRVIPGRTGDDGAFQLRVPGDHYVVAFHHADHVSRTEFVAVPRDRSGITVSMVPGGVLRGRVVNRVDGTPVARATVRVQDPSGTVSGQGVATGLASTRSDDQGHFELRGLASGNHELVATAPGYGTVDGTQLALGVGEQRDKVDVLVDRGFSLSGFVVSERDQTRGMKGVTVNAINFSDFTKFGVSEPTGEDGYFELHGLSPGGYTLTTFGEETIVSMGTTITVADDDVDDALIRLPEGAYIEGHVSPPGPGFVQASIEIDKENFSMLQMPQLIASMMSTMRTRRVDEDGRFRYGPVTAGSYLLHVSGEDGSRGVQTVEVGDETLRDVEIPLAEGLTVSGGVVDNAGAPVTGVTVALHRVEDNPLMNLAGFTGSAGTVDVTDDDGAFAITGLREGSYLYSVRDGRMLRIPWSDPADPDRPLRPRKLEDLTQSTTLELRVPAARPLEGIALGPDGRPLAGIWVEAWPDIPAQQWEDAIDTGTMAATNMATSQSARNGGQAESLYRQLSRVYRTPPVLTDEHGRFAVPGCRLPTYVVSGVGERGDLRGEHEGANPGAPLELELEAQATVTVSLVGDHPPAGAYRIALQGTDVRIQLAREDQRDVRIPRVRPGTYRAVVEAPGGVAARTVELEPGADVALSLALHGWSGVQGHLQNEAGDPVTGVTLFFERNDASLAEVMAGAKQMLDAMSGTSTNRVGTDGSFELGRLPPGPIKLRFLETDTFVTRAVLRLDLGQGEDRDLGAIEVVDIPSMSPKERGSVGMKLEIDDESVDEPRLVVSRVVPGKAADRAGLRAGDRILAADGHTAQDVSPEVVGTLIAWVTPGQRIPLQIEREGSSSSVTLVAGPAKAKDD